MADSLPIGGEEHGGSDYSSPITSPGSTPLTSQSPQHINDLHNMSDVDVGDLSQHHTVGPRKGQSASGFTFAQHKHTGTDGSKTGIVLANQDLTNLADKWLGIPWYTGQVLTPALADFNNAAFTDWFTGIVIPGTGVLPLWAQDGAAKLDIAVQFNPMAATAALSARFRLVTNAVNGNPTRLIVPTANTQYGLTVAQVGVTIPAGSTITTKVQALTSAAGIRFTNATVDAHAYITAYVYR